MKPTSEFDESMSKLALGLSNALNDANVRDYVRTESLKQFDGDYNFLLNPALEHTFKDGKTLAAKMAVGFDNDLFLLKKFVEA